MQTQRVAIDLPVLPGDRNIKVELDREVFARTGQASALVTVVDDEGTERTATLAMVPAHE